MSAVISNPNSPDGMFTYEEAQSHAHLFQGGIYYYSPVLKGYVLGSQPAHIIDPSMFPSATQLHQSPGVTGGLPGGTIGQGQRKVRRLGWVAD